MSSWCSVAIYCGHFNCHSLIKCSVSYYSLGCNNRGGGHGWALGLGNGKTLAMIITEEKKLRQAVWLLHVLKLQTIHREARHRTGREGQELPLRAQVGEKGTGKVDRSFCDNSSNSGRGRTVEDTVVFCYT